MTFTYQIGDGAHALDQQQWLDWHRGYQVVDAAGGSNLLSAGTNAFDVDAAAGDINFGGTTVTCSAETINLSADVDPDNPKKVTVYRDGAGALSYEAGIAEPAQDSGETRRDAYRPAPPTLEATDAVVLGTVWLAAGASSVVDNDIRDRRLPAEANVETLTADSGTIDTLSGTSADYDSVNAGELNTVAQLDPGDDIQAAIDAAHNSTDASKSGAIRLNPSGEWSFSDAPYRIKENVTVDARGTFGVLGSDHERVWEFEAGAVFLGHGHRCDVEPLTGTYFYIGDDGGNITRTAADSRSGAQGIYGYPSVWNSNATTTNDEWPIELQSTGGNPIADVHAEVHLGWSQNGVRYHCDDSTSGSYVNHNNVHLRGRIHDGKLVSCDGSVSNLTNLHNNRTELEMIQPGSPVGHMFYVDAGRDNIVTGGIADSGNFDTFAEFTANAGPRNQATTKHNTPGAVTNNSGHPSNAVSGLDTVGFEIADKGTISVAANGKTNVGITDDTAQLDVAFRVVADGAVVKTDHYYNGSRQEIEFREINGTATDVEYTIYRIAVS